MIFLSLFRHHISNFWCNETGQQRWIMWLNLCFCIVLLNGNGNGNRILKVLNLHMISNEDAMEN
jgi:hypothetical protein